MDCEADAPTPNDEPTPPRPLSGLGAAHRARQAEQERKRQDPAYREQEAAELEAARAAFRRTMSGWKYLTMPKVVGVGAFDQTGAFSKVAQGLVAGTSLDFGAGARQGLLKAGFGRGAAGIGYGEGLFALTRNPLDDWFKAVEKIKLTESQKSIADAIVAGIPEWQDHLSGFWGEDLDVINEEVREEVPTDVAEANVGPESSDGPADPWLVQHKTGSILTSSGLFAVLIAMVLYLELEHPKVLDAAREDADLILTLLSLYLGAVIAIALTQRNR